MTDEFDFDIVPVSDPEIVVVDKPASTPSTQSGAEHFMHAMAGNTDRLFDIADSYMEIKKMQAQGYLVREQSEAKIRELREKANAYVEMKRADTRDTVKKIDALRRLVNDINASPQCNLTGDQLTDLLRLLLEDKK